LSQLDLFGLFSYSHPIGKSTCHFQGNYTLVGDEVREVVWRLFTYEGCNKGGSSVYLHPDPFYVTAPNITSSNLLPNSREQTYSVENYPHTITTIFFISPTCNVSVIIEGSCNMQRFLIFVAQFANFRYFDTVVSSC
jgi:hypothetical protein